MTEARRGRALAARLAACLLAACLLPACQGPDLSVPEGRDAVRSAAVGEAEALAEAVARVVPANLGPHERALFVRRDGAGAVWSASPMNGFDLTGLSWGGGRAALITDRHVVFAAHGIKPTVGGTLTFYDREGWPVVRRLTAREVLAPLELSRLVVGPPHPHAWTLWLMATPLLMGAALFFDFFPREGPPAFGPPAAPGDPPVFNFGWPVVTSLYAPNRGFRLGPLAWPTFLAQLLLYAAGTVLVWVRQRRTAVDPGVSGLP